jgi:hypothetical protein
MTSVVHHVSSGRYDPACRRPPFSSQSEGMTLHAPATLEELVKFSLPWLSFALVLCLELTIIDRLCWDPFSSCCPPSSLNPL